MGVGLPVCLNPAYPHGMTLWGSEVLSATAKAIAIRRATHET
jgi:hypothetical protein